MASGHVKTWRKWVMFVSPMGRLPVLEKTDVDAMAEALALASPGGPRAIPCEDDCKCDEARASHFLEAAMRLHSELARTGYEPACDPERTESLLLRLQDAIKRDLSQVSALEISQLAILKLADWRVIVSDRNAWTVHHRHVYPHTWEVIKEGVP